MNLLLIPLVVLAGMGLSMEAGLIGPLGTEVGHLWATLSIFGVGTVLTGLLVLFFGPRNAEIRTFFGRIYTTVNSMSPSFTPFWPCAAKCLWSNKIAPIRILMAVI